MVELDVFALNLFEKTGTPIVFVGFDDKDLSCNNVALSMLGIGNEAELSPEFLNKKLNFDGVEEFLRNPFSFDAVDFFAEDSCYIMEGYKLECGGALVFKTNPDSEKLRSAEEEIVSLRKENHDYRNQIHMLMGEGITGGGTDIVKNNPKGIPSDVIREIIAYIEQKFIAELLIGKLTRIYELGIKFNILPDSVCKELTHGIGFDKYITIIGNLIDNATDELEIGKIQGGIIDFRIVTNKDWTKISVTDNGRGTDNEEKILNKGFTTKGGKSRGLGLFVVDEIAKKYNGSVVIESYPGEGFGIDVTIFSMGD